MFKPRSRLSIDVNESFEDSFIADGNVFVKDNVAISSTGIAMKNNPKTFTLAYSELDIGEIIGRGSSSVVIQAYHAPTSTPIALKVFNMSNKGKREQLIREVCTLYDAHCPSLITFYGAFYREGSITIALEYMDGGSLANVIDQVGALPEPILASVAFQILWGLAYLKHEKRVHRDVKPSNILINSRGEVKVTDFGIAAELQSTIQMCGTFVGTFKYMSPERIRNEPYSFSSDIWSFGLVMLECATGQYPFHEQANCIEMAQTILDTERIDVPGHFSEMFQQFIAQCVNKNPSQRLPAEVLLGSPWLQRHGATSYEASVLRVKNWIDSLGGRSSESSMDLSDHYDHK